MLSEYRTKIEQLKGQKQAIQSRYDNNETVLIDLNSSYISTEKAQFIIQKVSKETQENLKFNIENIVSMALESVFTVDPYSFNMDFEIQRNKTECNLSFMRRGYKYKPMSSSGFGTVNISAFALRVSLWAISKQYSPVFILDEPFRDLSMIHQPNAGKMLKELSEKLGIQFIISTHREPLIEYADSVHKVKMTDGVSRVRKVS